MTVAPDGQPSGTWWSMMIVGVPGLIGPGGTPRSVTTSPQFGSDRLGPRILTPAHDPYPRGDSDPEEGAGEQCGRGEPIRIVVREDQDRLAPVELGDRTAERVLMI